MYCSHLCGVGSLERPRMLSLHAQSVVAHFSTVHEAAFISELNACSKSLKRQ
ncbi:hypothetical protein BAUCODRAFT_436060 [Baudoinia panamericana UAMH 10762]|uniref:Uncharacterized protein n=1 Tax=Baudoinia panamericana (strain UAMH 10762) TaxID=717646 RepID=M2NCW8_BAUPA|nr:uncharacterized protein BAUCODRAFT_436060 [Baudoinia panamericana UAMH 10762]EMC97034.1 hypothetical protein BAUCODRAFT_436060 [Baudoinia panamericana UAMH 10762]